MKIAVRNLKNKKVRDVEVPDEVFDYPYNEHLIHLAVVANMAAARSGSHKTKGRSEISGGGRKVWRQKGTGRARMGSIRSPLWRGGGTVFGPQPRSYEKKLTPREKKNALRSALSRKLRDEGLLVVDSLELETHRTASLADQLAGLGVAGKALLVDGLDNENLSLASRNLADVKMVDALAVSVYDVVDRGQIVVSERGLDKLVEVLR